MMIRFLNKHINTSYQKNLLGERFSEKIKYLVLAIAYFPHERVSSAQQGLTSLFEMGRGVALATNHQH